MASIDSFIDQALSYQYYNYEKFCTAMWGEGTCDYWCAAFVSVVTREVGLDAPWSGSCGDQISWWKSKNRYYKGVDGIQRGDIVYFDWGGSEVQHVGIVTGTRGVDYIESVEGNPGDYDPDETYVQVLERHVSSIAGYARPVFDDSVSYVATSGNVIDPSLLEEMANAEELDLTTYQEALESEIAGALDRKTVNMKTIEYTNRFYGSPFRFTDMTDPPVKFYNEDGTHAFTDGRTYVKNIGLEAPLVHFIPGVPSYLRDMSKKNIDVFERFVNDRMKGNEVSENVLKKITGIEGRYFNFVPAYAEYQRYFNLLCRTCAIYMGIGDKIVPGAEDKIFNKYKNYNYGDWQDNGNTYTDRKLQAIYEFNKDDGEYMTNTTFETESGILNFFTDSAKNIAEDLFGGSKSVKCYVDAGASFSESFSNDTAPSQIASLFDSGETLAREVQFFASGGKSSKVLGALLDGVTGLVAGLTEGLLSVLQMGNSNLVNMVSYAKEIIGGSNIIFPEMWQDSKYSKSYSCSLNLVSPYGDDESIFINIIMPIMAILALALPRQTSANAFTAPMYVRVISKGWFSSDMAIISGVSIDKGGTDAWSASGLPLSAKVNIDIHDLYTSLSMPNSSQPGLFFSNDSLIDFLATTCGVDTTVPNVALKVSTFINTIANDVIDIPRNMYSKATESVNNFIMRHSGLFRN